MSQVINIEVGGKSYPLKFGYGSLRQLGILWKVKDPAEVGERLQQVFAGIDEKTGKIEFDQIDAICELVYSAIKAFDPKKKIDITPDDIGTDMMNGDLNMAEIIGAYSASLTTGKAAASGKGSG